MILHVCNIMPVKRLLFLLMGLVEMQNRVECINGWLINYDPEDITPIRAVTEQWGDVKQKDMLIVLVHSQVDNLIDVKDSRILCDAMVKKGFKPYFIATALGRHGFAFSDSDNKVTGKIRTVLVKHKLFSLFSKDFFIDRSVVVDEYGFSDPTNIFCEGGVIKNKDGKIKLTSQGDQWMYDMRPYLSGFEKFCETVKSFFD